MIGDRPTMDGVITIAFIIVLYLLMISGAQGRGAEVRRRARQFHQSSRLD